MLTIIKRKFFSALWRLKQAAIKSYQTTVQTLIEALTDRYWLLDLLPLFAKKKQGVLLVRLDLIGDFVLWLDAAQVYRQLYPQKKIVLAVNGLCAEVAATLTLWDEVIPVSVQKLRTDYLYRLRVLAKIRWRNFEVAIQPTFSREFVGDLLVRASNSPTRIGYSGDLHNITDALKARSDVWYTKLIQNDVSSTMELTANAHFVRELGLSSFLSNVPIIPKTHTLPSQFHYSEPYLVIAVGASWKPRMWPINYFADLMKQLRVEFSMPILLCGSQADYDLCLELSQLANVNSVTNLAGQTTILDLIEIIRQADLVVSNDSSPTHIAAATGAPVVSVVGGGHFGRFWPYETETKTSDERRSTASYQMECFGCNWKCKFELSTNGAVPCISNVSVQGVLSLCKIVLRRHL